VGWNRRYHTCTLVIAFHGSGLVVALCARVGGDIHLDHALCDRFGLALCRIIRRTHPQCG
jgi:hypothetical protein